MQILTSPPEERQNWVHLKGIQNPPTFRRIRYGRGGSGAKYTDRLPPAQNTPHEMSVSKKICSKWADTFFS
jgi:hypothetical protein